ALALAGSASEVRALDAAAFGWRAKDPRGPRPLLVIWVRHPDGKPATEIARRKQYYEELMFGRPDRGAHRDARRGFELTLVGYFNDQSGGKFTWRRAGFVGPLTAQVKGKEPVEIAQIAITAAAQQGLVDFKAFDANHDGKISPDELAILILLNEPHAIANQFYGRGRGFAIPGQNVIFAGGSAVFNDAAGLAPMVHELFHTVGGVDLYGPWGGCYHVADRLTPMGLNPADTKEI